MDAGNWQSHPIEFVVQQPVEYFSKNIEEVGGGPETKWQELFCIICPFPVETKQRRVKWQDWDMVEG